MNLANGMKTVFRVGDWWVWQGVDDSLAAWPLPPSCLRPATFSPCFGFVKLRFSSTPFLWQFLLLLVTLLMPDCCSLTLHGTLMEWIGLMHYYSYRFISFWDSTLYTDNMGQQPMGIKLYTHYQGSTTGHATCADHHWQSVCLGLQRREAPRPSVPLPSHHARRYRPA